MKRQKHPKIGQKNIGNYGVSEFALVGISNSTIKNFVISISKKISSLKITFLDKNEEVSSDVIVSFVDGQEVSSTENKIDVDVSFSSFELRTFFKNCDLTLVNGNYFDGRKQLLFIGEKESLSNDLGKIKNPVAVVLKNEVKELPKALLGNKPEVVNLPIFKMDDLKGITDFICSQSVFKPKLKGLVLVGGKSTRMGEDKAMLNYHGQPQWKYSYELLSQFCDDVFVSVGEEDDRFSEVAQIQDKFLGMGPLGGILSAFQSDPNSAWLVVACDLPLLSQASLHQLVVSRNPQKYATSFQSPQMDFPEPLICIWEPKAYGKLLEFLSWGYSSPMKTLVNSDIELVIPNHENEMANANTPEEYRRLKGLL